ncbi:hypothetical protein P3T36_004588 [Kitasatospora sp. MAP12-15]|uniref:lanthionine synthetase C family protein n=1 Tax=unclassified Kitasatospora TaxID=2633591 RepID=UPI002476ED1B|nr:lanthionine synthetase C family protein [Kitasatospora sp. MAP12-44]MDH6111434.1 hypothetical protein [Kitasatospora sp. MAP12-44]
MADPTSHLIEQIADVVADPANVTAELRPAAASTLADGLPGTALLLAVLSRSDPLFAGAADRHWEAAARLLTSSAADGIYAGPGALAASLILGSAYLPNGRVQLDAVTRASAWLSARAEGLAAHQHQRLRDGRLGTPWAVYDTIKGLTGIGRVLLAAHQLGHQEAEPGLTAALTTLTDMITTPAGDLPGWWLATPDHALATVSGVPDTGSATTGAAHGIAGPLALLDTAHTYAVTVPGQRDAIETAARWLVAWSASGPSWPPHIPGRDLLHRPDPDRLSAIPGRRDAWCYGTPGVAAALHHAGRTLGDPSLTHHARRALDLLAQRAPDSWDTDGPGLCHGTAGVLQAATRTGCVELAAQAAVRTITLHHQSAEAPQGLGFLTGRAGTALALADHHHSSEISQLPTWDGLLLLA